MSLTPDDLQARFGFKKLNAVQIKKVRAIREKFAQFAEELNLSMAEGRYKSMCLTALEEACTWGIKSFVHDGEAEE